MTVGINRDNITIVLHRPRYPENIGSAARAMCNMGFSRLSVVDPGIWDETRIRRLATHAAGSVVDRIQRFDSLGHALEPFGYVVGTTARMGNLRPVLKSPELLADQLIAISTNNPVAILFGSEDRGLTNDELKRCDRLVNIPTAGFSSLNLAQAVMVVCYCLSTTTRTTPPAVTPRLAKRIELDHMYDELTRTLVQLEYIQADNPDYWMQRIRRFLGRLSLRAGEVGIIRGICKQIRWYGEKCYTDGLHARCKRKDSG
ncbi:MAG: RNA methyltransferase [Desulfosarcina sp.]|jgi:tRNA/rRNA methyltransferase